MDARMEAMKQDIIVWLGCSYNADHQPVYGFGHFSEDEVNELVVELERTIRLFDIR